MQSKFMRLFIEGRNNLESARTLIDLGKSDEAEKLASLAIFQASQAYLLKMTGSSADTNNDQRTRPARRDECVDAEQVMDLSQAYQKEYCGGEARAQIPLEKSLSTVENAIRFLAYIETLIEEGPQPENKNFLT